MLEKSKDVSSAVSLSVTCVSAYISCYILRNILSVVTPDMIIAGYSTEYIGLLSSVYYVIYACGQLVNGYIGEVVKAKYMISLGLVCASMCSIVFAFCGAGLMGVFLFAIMGFSLSMLRGPIVKTICENTNSKISHLACVFLSFSGFVGPLAASLLSLLVGWRVAFIVSGIIGFVFAAFVYILLITFEARGTVVYRQKEKSKKMDFLGIFKLEGIIFYLSIVMVCETSYIAIGFWLPTYFTERLGFDSGTAGVIFSAMSFIRAFTPFIALLVLKLMKNNDKNLIRTVFTIAIMAMIAALFITANYFNVIMMLVALICIGMASTMVWSNYIPNNSSSGLTSSLNGFLDFTGYAVASVCNLFVSYAVGWFGWDGVVVMWISVAALGLLTTFVLNNKRKMK